MTPHYTRLALACAAAGSFLLNLTPARAVLWDGPAGGAFDDAVNWTDDVLPDSSTSAELGAGSAVYSGTTVPEMTISGFTATSGSFTQTAGTLTNNNGGDFGTEATGGASFSMTGGTYNLTANAVRFGSNTPTASFSMSGAATMNVSTGHYFVFGDNTTLTATMSGNAAMNVTSAFRFFIGDGGSANTTFTVTDNASVISNAWTFSGNGGGTGALILEGDEDSTNGKPSFAVGGGGAYIVAEGGGTEGSVTLTGDADFQMNGDSDHGLVVGHNGGTGTFTAGGTSTASSADEVWIGNGGGTGTMTIKENATFTASQIVKIGKGGGSTGTLTLEGNAIFNGAKILMSDSGSGTTLANATINMNGSSKMNLALLTVGHFAGTGTTAAVNINDSATLTVTDHITVGRDDSTSGVGVDAVINLNEGGILATRWIENGGGTGTHTLNIDGGTIKALEDGGDFFAAGGSPSVPITVNILDGGLIFDTDGHVIGIGADMGGEGGLTVTGGGMLTLNVASSYQGDTILDASTLSFSSIYLPDTANVYLTTGSTLDLAFVGTDTIGALFINGVPLPVGFYDAATLPDYIDGDGILEVTAVPEPTTVGMSVVGMLGLTVLIRRFRRKA